MQTPGLVVHDLKRKLVLLAFAAALLIAGVGTTLMRIFHMESLFTPRHFAIRDLQEVPLGRIRVHGVVTHADPSQDRFWIQDQTAAIAIPVNPARLGIHAGQTVEVEATKTQPYDPVLGLSSIRLTEFGVSPSRFAMAMPDPAEASLSTLPEKDKNGIRVRVTAVVHAFLHDSAGYTEVDLGDAGRELPAIVMQPDLDLTHWVNSRVQVIGVSETIHDGAGNVLERHLWVESVDDIHVGEARHRGEPLYSVRSIYASPRSRDGYLVRIRGRVAAQLGTPGLTIEDRWGTIDCRTDLPVDMPVGKLVEITGFPVNDGLLISIHHSSVAELSPAGAEQGENDTKAGVLTTVAAVRELDPERASDGVPVRLTGLITFNDSDWHQMFLQDSTAGIYIRYSGDGTRLFQGQVVTVIGITNAGEFAPVIISPKFILHGPGKMPRPIPIAARDVFSGALDSQFVEVEGVVHPPRPGPIPKHMSFELYSSLGQVHVSTGPGFQSEAYVRSLEDATVRVRGVCGTLFNSRRQLVGFQLFVSSPRDMQVLEPAGPGPFQEDALPIANLLRFSARSNFNHRTKVAGSVTLLGDGFFYIQDATGGLEVQGDHNGAKLADWVEVVGYASPGGYSPRMTDAMVRVVRSNVPVGPERISPESAVDGRFDSHLVTIEGRLLSAVHSLSGRTLVLYSEGRTFNAQLLSRESSGQSPPLQEGSVLRLTGICSAQINMSTTYLLLSQEPVGFRLVVRSPGDIEVLQAASWWTASRTLTALAILTTATCITFGWVGVLRRRVWRQMKELERATEKTRAIRDLAAAMQDVALRKDFTAQVSTRGGEEIAQLGMHFNRMLRELHLRDLAKREAESRLQRQALTDELTGLPNRRLLTDRLQQTLAGAARARHLVALLYLDLDGFKLVNDSLGHAIGDILLSQVAQRLRSRLRQSDTLARLGGDEFTVILTKLQKKEDALLVGQTLLEVLAPPFLVDSHEINIGASIGISLYPENGGDASELLQQADSAMYAAKRNGKNRVLYFTDELGSFVRERLNLETQLRGATARGEISIHYQPEFDVATRRLVRFEALARWNHPNLGTIPPGKFIPIAEESGIIVPLGAFILERACADAVAWQAVAPYPVQVAVNVSSMQFARDSFVEEVEQVLRRSGLKPGLLQIELTESVMLCGAERAAETMRRLGALGVTIAIDDFGTGYSCFSYLPKLPFNVLKIDRAFVKELATRSEMKAMVQSLVTLAHNLNMQVVVEGIETSEQLELIARVGGNQVQGYLLGRPTPDPLRQLKTLCAAPGSAGAFAVGKGV
ncbi:MAG TPA: EAL domain-containing protein [Terriglobales bacterium]|nr:EAL domain-containing protein [Terriglobales bacterium]